MKTFAYDFDLYDESVYIYCCEKRVVCISISWTKEINKLYKTLDLKNNIIYCETCRQQVLTKDAVATATDVFLLSGEKGVVTYLLSLGFINEQIL